VSSLDDYLEQLRRALPAGSRPDVLAEVEDHLRESSAVHGEEEALARFGPAHDLARALAGTAAKRETLRGALLLVFAFVAAAFAVYSVPENLLPPWGAAPHERWPQGPFPAGVASKQDAIMVLFLVAGILAVAGAAAAARRRVRLALALLAGGQASLVTLTVLAAVLAVQWERALPAAPGLIWVAAYALVQSWALTWSAAFATRGALAHLVASR
jgi:hypothetical protein